MFLDFVYVQNVGLWCIEDWYGYQGFIDVVIGQGECGVLYVFDGQFVVVGFFVEGDNFFFDVCE